MYESVQNQKSDWFFYLGIADYMKFCLANDQIKFIIDEEAEKMEKHIKNLEKEKKELRKETEVVAKEVFKIIADNKLDDVKEVKEIMREYEDYVSGRLHSSIGKSIGMYETLASLIFALCNAGHEFLVEEYISKDSSNPNIKRCVFSKHIDQVRDGKERLKYLMKTEIFGVQNELLLAYEAVLKADEKNEELKEGKDKGKFWDWMNWGMIAGEMKKILEMHEHPYRNYSNFRPIQFKRDDYNSYFSRFHVYLLDSLSNIGYLIDEPEKSDKLEYNQVRSLLYFMGKEFDFSKKNNQKDLLNTLFKDKTKKWFYDEVQEDWDSVSQVIKYPDDIWRKFYNAGDEINRYVKSETGIGDFIDKNTGNKGYIRINPKYFGEI